MTKVFRRASGPLIAVNFSAAVEAKNTAEAVDFLGLNPKAVLMARRLEASGVYGFNWLRYSPALVGVFVTYAQPAEAGLIDVDGVAYFEAEAFRLIRRRAWRYNVEGLGYGMF